MYILGSQYAVAIFVIAVTGLFCGCHVPIPKD